MTSIARRLTDIAFGAFDRARYLFDAPYYDGSGMLYCQMQCDELYYATMTRWE